MDYEIDLQTKLKGNELEKLWSDLVGSIQAEFEKIPPEQRKQQNEELVDGLCKTIATNLGLYYFRQDNWLNFCDRSLAPN